MQLSSMARLADLMLNLSLINLQLPSMASLANYSLTRVVAMHALSTCLCSA